MRKTDISTYKEKKNPKDSTAVFYLKTAGSFLMKSVLTVLLVLSIAGMLVCFNILFYIVGLAAEPTGIDLDARSLSLSSSVYVMDPETDEFEEYQILYGTENRFWVDYNEMPQAMLDAIVSIEDKRFYKHNGVDWIRTGSAVLNLAGGDDSYGGSTLTQQLIKNLTEDDEVSVSRKIREIVRALKIEQEYTKDEILEAYLNVVNFGGSCQGVEAAAQRYFGKSISECSIAECASIAGITQNPSAWDPLIYPENNQIRRELIIDEMYAQEKITKAEYDAAMAESATMTFKDSSEEDEVNTPIEVQNWYMDELVFDLADDLAEFYNISPDAAIDKIYTEGLKIYCAMDLEAQEMIEKEAQSIDRTYDDGLQIAMSLIGLDGRVIATVGSADKKEGNLVFDRATMATLQPGSSIKPVVAYPYAVNQGLLNWSSIISDQPLEEWVYPNGTHGPNNWYGYNHEDGLFMVDAIEWSANCTAAQTIKMIGGPQVAYNHARNHLGFTHLTEEGDKNAYASFSLGGMNGGVTVREMAAAYAYLGNGGRYYEPYTYYKVTDRNGNVIIDNTTNIYSQAYSKDTASVMNRILQYNVNNCSHTTAWRAGVYGWEIAGKTGTTDGDTNSWFCGVSPYASLAVWTGFDNPERIYSTGIAAGTFSNVMSQYLEDKDFKTFTLSENVVEAEFCSYTGKLAGAICSDTRTGYYSADDMPETCTSHSGPGIGSNDKTTSPTDTTGTEATLPTVIIDFGDTTSPSGALEPNSTDPAE
ncbi:MAG: transglycosylase domain-containing protein [Eubacteriales bacterium]|nr:transglycosylase domain-containing protein [Eubacteriales bacterium]